jgi:hypothetical protein
MKRCKHPGCRLAGIKSCECFGPKVAAPTVYVVWHARTHPEKAWAVGREIRPGCLKVAAYVESRKLADLLAKQLSDGDYLTLFAGRVRILLLNRCSTARSLAPKAVDAAAKQMGLRAASLGAKRRQTPRCDCPRRWRALGYHKRRKVRGGDAP